MRLNILVIGFFVSLAGLAAAEPETVVLEDQPQATSNFGDKEFFDRIWAYSTLYETDEEALLERIRFRGRLQADFPVFDSNRSDHSDALIRRFRLGLQSEWRHDITLHAEVNLDVTCDKGEACNDDGYTGLTDAYLSWAPSDAFDLKIGKSSAPFTLDGVTSSKKLLTLERSNLSNNLWFPVEYFTGIGASGRAKRSQYRVGVYSSSTGDEFGKLDGGYFLLFSYGHDLSSRLDIDEFLVSLDYVYNKADHKNEATRDLNHVFSANIRIASGAWGLRSDLSGGIGYGTQEDLIGITVLPYYSLTEKFQLVVRYTYLHSFDGEGVRLGRYESRLDSRRGDHYNEAFGGINWFIYGHNLKLQTGLKYTWMDGQKNFRGWGWTTGIRIAW